MNNIYYVDSKKDNCETIQALLDQCRGQKAEIIFREGTYFFDKGLVMTEEHCGLTLRGEGKVQFRGGKRLHTWSKVANTPIADRFDEEVRDSIYVCDLSEEGIDQVGGFVARGYSHPIEASHSELFCNDMPMKLSQYPKGDDFLTISKVEEEMREKQWNLPVGRLEGGFYFEDSRPARWAESDQICTMGYWAWDYANSTECVELLDAEKGFVKNAEPYGTYFFRVGQRFRFFHILEEVNQPGDYFIDQKERKAYIYPVKMEETTEICISLLEQPLLYLNGSKDIKVEGITFEMVRGHAFCGEGTNNVVINDCYFRNIGNYAVDFVGGYGNCVLNSSIHDCGAGGVAILGGDRRTLISADAQVCNNHLYNIAKWTKSYHPPISLVGVGMTARHNLIHDSSHTAIMYWGNEMTIEDNEIYSVVMETGDAGAIYTGRDYTFRGNRVCHNYIHHLGGVGVGTMGIYNDDGASGTVMENNYFEEVSKAAFMGGGRDYVLRNNVFVKCYPAIALDCRGADDNPVWRNMAEVTLKERFYEIAAYPKQGLVNQKEMEELLRLGEEKGSALSEIYLQRYPELAQLHEFYSNPVNGETRIPASATISNNVICSKVKFRYRYVEPQKTYYEYGEPIQCDKFLKSYITDTSRDMLFTIGGEKAELYLNSNYQAVPEDFEDAGWGNLAVKAESKAYSYGYRDAGFDSIGLETEKRSVNPPIVLTRVMPAEDGSRSIVIGIRNKGTQVVDGNLNIYSPHNVKFDATTISFHIEGGEEKTYPLQLLEWQKEFEVEVRSDVPGVRPSRNVFEIEE